MPATATTASLKGAIVTARNTVAAALADSMKAAALTAIERADYTALALEALDGIDIGDADAITEAAEETLAGHDWEIAL